MHKYSIVHFINITLRRLFILVYRDRMILGTFSKYRDRMMLGTFSKYRDRMMLGTFSKYKEIG